MVKEIDKFTIIKAQRGSKRAFKALYDHYAPSVWRLSYRYCNGEQDLAGEIVQNVFVKVHRALHTFNHQSAFSTWLYRITYNAAMQVHGERTKWQRTMVPLEDTNIGFQDKDAYETHQQAEQILQLLSSEERFLVTAREVDGLSYQELASITGEAQGALRTRLFRIKASVRERFLKEQQRTA